jgi:hypothetical protein
MSPIRDAVVGRVAAVLERYPAHPHRALTRRPAGASRDPPVGLVSRKADPGH